MLFLLRNRLETLDYRRFKRRLADVDFFFGVVGVIPAGDVKPRPLGAGALLAPNEVAPPNRAGAGDGPNAAGGGVDPLNENAEVPEVDGAGAVVVVEKALGAGAVEEKPKLDVAGAGAVDDDAVAGAGV
jgi:hypothetical protein